MGQDPIISNMYDGKGNVVKVATGDNSDGRPVQSTGETVEEAVDKMDKSEIVGEGFNKPAKG